MGVVYSNMTKNGQFRFSGWGWAVFEYRTMLWYILLNYIQTTICFWKNKRGLSDKTNIAIAMQWHIFKEQLGHTCPGLLTV